MGRKTRKWAMYSKKIRRKNGIGGRKKGFIEWSGYWNRNHGFFAVWQFRFLFFKLIFELNEAMTIDENRLQTFSRKKIL